MGDVFFPGQSRLIAKALLIGERLDLRDIEKSQRLGGNPLLIKAGKGGCSVLFRYGAVVLFGLGAAEEADFLQSLLPLVASPYDSVESEQVVLEIDESKKEGIEDGLIILRSFSLERLQLVAEVLAKSVVLDFYETSVAESFKRIEPLAMNLQRSGRPGSEGRDLLRHIGDTLSIQGRMVGRVEVVEKPDLLWYHPELERLYVRLEDEYELNERNLALERKLDMISRTAETLLSLLQNKRSLRVEWYITILIVFEIILTLYEMFFAHGG